MGEPVKRLRKTPGSRPRERQRQTTASELRPPSSPPASWSQCACRHGTVSARGEVRPERITHCHAGFRCALRIRLERAHRRVKTRAMKPRQPSSRDPNRTTGCSELNNTLPHPRLVKYWCHPRSSHRGLWRPRVVGAKDGKVDLRPTERFPRTIARPADHRA